MPKSIGLPNAGKAKKPRPDFPLFPHASGRWAKKVRQKLHYFGKVSDDTQGEAALALWLEQKDALLAGRIPRKRTGNEKTLEDICDAFMLSKERARDAGELAPRTYKEYFDSCKRLLDHFGADRIVDEQEFTTDDFGKYRAELAATRGPVALGNEIVRARMVFKFGFDERLLPAPIRFGKSFSLPSERSQQRAKAEAGPKMFQAEEIRAIVEDFRARNRADMVAITLLGINAAFGQNDISLVPMKAFDLKGGWVRFPRPKTGAPRRAKLWPETVEALTEAFKRRPEAKNRKDSHLAFLTPSGLPWIRAIEETTRGAEDEEVTTMWKSRIDSLGKVFTLCLHRLSIEGRRGYYGLRHSFETVADNRCRDEAACNHVMGHTDGSVKGGYRDHFEDDRLSAIADAVRSWLFA